MRVVKVLNNSLVLALDDRGQEIILMGKGIGFHKSIGYQLKKHEVEKVFVLKDRMISRNIIRLAAETDSVYFEITKNTIDYAKEHFHMTLLDHIYLSLTDHIAYCVRRVQQGIEVPNFYNNDVELFNPNEFQLGDYLIAQVKEKLGIELPEDEAGNIAFHFINAQVDHPYNDQNRKIRQLSNNVLEIVKYYYHLVYRTDSVVYNRFATHVRLFAQRMIAGQQLDGDASRMLYQQIAQVCKSELECVRRIDLFIQEKFGVPLTDQESMYLAMHIHLILEER